MNNLDVKELNNYLYSDNDLTNCVIEINNNCNFKCDHCYLKGSKNTYMNFKIFKRIIDELYELGCLSILITGGEPTLNKDFKKMYLYAKMKGFLVSINTNASLITEDILNLFKEYKPYTIEISIYGINKKTYQNFTHNNESYENVFKNIKRLKDYNLDINLKTIITNHNNYYIDKIIALAKEFNLPFRYDYIIFPKITNNDSSNNELVSVDKIIEIIKKDSRSEKYFNEKILNMKASNSKKIFQCSGGESNLYINSNGDINMCVVQVNNENNISNTSIKQAIKNFKKFKQLEYFNSKCENCAKKSICRYCPSRFFLETKNYNVCPDWYCKLADLIIDTYDTFVCDDINPIIIEMFQIISKNMEKINGIKVKDDDFKIWSQNMRNIKDLKTIIVKNTFLKGYLQFIKKENEVCICEIQIEENSKHDKSTFKKLLNKLIHSIDYNDKTIIYGNISKTNTNSKNVFTHIGFVNSINNRYEISIKDLLKYLNN